MNLAASNSDGSDNYQWKKFSSSNRNLATVFKSWLHKSSQFQFGLVIAYLLLSKNGDLSDPKNLMPISYLSAIYEFTRILYLRYQGQNMACKSLFSIHWCITIPSQAQRNKIENAEHIIKHQKKGELNIKLFELITHYQAYSTNIRIPCWHETYAAFRIEDNRNEPNRGTILSAQDTQATMNRKKFTCLRQMKYSYPLNERISEYINSFKKS